MRLHAGAKRVIAALGLVTVLASGACQRPRGAPASSSLDVVTLNLWHDKQDWPHRQDLIVAELEALSPEVIVLQEVLQHAALPNQAEVLASRLGYQYRFFSADAPDQARRYGNAILVRGAIEQSREIRLAPLDDYRNAGWVLARIDGRSLNVYATHLHYKPDGAAIRAQQVTGLLALIDETRGDVPSIIGGDFNTRSDAPELASLRERFVEAYGQAHEGQDANTPMHSTLNMHLGHPPIRIDHIFAQRGAFRVADARLILNRADATGAWPSDHYGVRVRLVRASD
jgi:endonuclease/exonuclease/phosphatase family metal-dependent hydrolase